MFDTYYQTIQLTNNNAWIYKPGNNTGWSKKDIDTKGWMGLNPNQLSVKNADQNGILEGWLRLRFKLDSSFHNMNIGIEAIRWAAVDIYIDGTYITSYGSTGLNGKPYEENRNTLTDIYPLQIEVGKEHLLALHIVDHTAPLQKHFLKTESLVETSFANLVVLTGPLAFQRASVLIRGDNGFGFLFTGVNGVLALLFWLLFLQNRREKNIFLIALSTSFFFGFDLLITMSGYSFKLDFNTYWPVFFIALQLWPIAIASMVYTTGEIFGFRYRKFLIVFGIFFVGYSIAAFYFSIDPYFVWHPLLAILLMCYIIFSSRKRLKGAQWAVVTGIILTAIFSFAWAFLTKHYKSLNFPYNYLYLCGENLSLPLSLMVYVAIRFREILTDVQVNAKQVIQLSEEKKEQALRQQKHLEEEVARQTIELRTSLENLKSTQAQLIHSEKMASLGELTAGIAHEIQNPLNFVNNFSDVNREMLTELNEEISRGNYSDASIIAKDIIANEEKINHHGKRADAIVKGMLQHSRKSEGTKEPTEINALCEEYLRLSYHGIRAKDKNFQSEMITEFDERAGKINVVPQDLGRALLNLYSNAFYAVNEKAKSFKGDYKPVVKVKTTLINEKVEITISDNGNGIPSNITDKIFQPFFTTKPTGQGTGLGLSLVYDIITKEHNGTIHVKSTEGEGSVFVITLESHQLT
jgi:signal transduction histidine kinase